MSAKSKKVSHRSPTLNQDVFDDSVLAPMTEREHEVNRHLIERVEEVVRRAEFSRVPNKAVRWTVRSGLFACRMALGLSFREATVGLQKQNDHKPQGERRDLVLDCPEAMEMLKQYRGYWNTFPGAVVGQGDKDVDEAESEVVEAASVASTGVPAASSGVVSHAFSA